MKAPLWFFAFVLLFALVTPGTAQTTEITKREYLAYITAAGEEGWRRVDADREQWKKSIDLKFYFGYNPPGNEVYLAALSANLYEATKDEKYLDRVQALLLYYGKHREAYPPDYFKSKPEYAAGLPALPNIFSFQKYSHAYAILRKYRTLGERERATIEENIAGSADFFVTFQEWGPMNRAMLRAECLLYAAKVIPRHPHRDRWVMVGEAIAADNRENWEIEDATGYNGVWLYSLLGYASDVRQDEGFYLNPMMHYYFQYFLALMSPAGVIPDFGDADWTSSWDRMIPFFEKGATVYRNPELRWAAAQLFRKFLDPPPARPSVFTGLILSDAYRWASFDIHASAPTSGSQQVLDDIVGKKIVFRNGWSPQSTYMLYNYRDEGDGGWLFREYLRTSIPVEEEKMHHGHSDENSIPLLMKNNSILLHDGGYRDYMPSGPYGAFRADYYHNKVVVRDGKIALGQKEGEYRYSIQNQAAVPGQRMLEFFRNSGAHRDVRTRKIDFLSLKNYDMARTRVTDEQLGYEADRLITYVRDLDCFVVFDVVRFTRNTYLTMANLWHTRKIHSRGPGWYDTSYDSLRVTDVHGEEALLIQFPVRAQLEDGVEQENRYYQQEQAIYQMIGRHGYPGDMQAFVTILTPHKQGSDLRPLLQQIHMLDVQEYPKAVGLEFKVGTRTYLIGAKLDLQAELVRDWRRPMYTYDSGKISYGEYETDAHNLFVVEDASSVHYAMVGGVKITRAGHMLHEQLPVESGLNFDGSPPLPGTGKLRYWEETVKK